MKLGIFAGDAVGGVRKHVHDLIIHSPPDVDILYIHSARIDDVARNDFGKAAFSRVTRRPLLISKMPAISDITNIYQIFRECRRAGVQVIHGHGAKGGLYARVVGLMLGVPVLFTPHGGSVHARFGKWKQRLFASIEFVLKPCTTMFIFESNYTRKAFEKMAGVLPEEKFIVNFNGVDADVLQGERCWSEGLDACVRLLVVGLLSAPKGQAYLLRAVAELIRRGRQVQLNVCGDGETRNELILLAEELGIARQVVFHGDVQNVRDFYERCNIVVVPSLFESFGYVAVEASYMKRPVIASRVGGIPEVVLHGETGLLVSERDPSALAAAIDQVIDSPSATNRMINAGYSRCISLFNAKSMADRVFSQYRRLIG